MLLERSQVPSPTGVPQPDGIVHTPTCDGVAIGTERNAIDPICMPGERSQVISGMTPTSASQRYHTFMPCERMQVFSRIGVPQADGCVSIPTCDGAAIRTERNATDHTFMPCERMQVFSRIGVPQADGCVSIPTSDGVAVGTERNAIDPRFIQGERMQLFFRIGVPQPDGTVQTSTNDGAAIGTERNAPDPARMPGEQADLLMGRRIVNPNADTAGDC